MRTVFFILLVSTYAFCGAKVRSGAEMSVGYLGGGDNTPEKTIGQYFNFQDFGTGRTGNSSFLFLGNGNPTQQQTSWTGLSLTAPIYVSFWLRLDNNNLPNANNNTMILTTVGFTNYIALVWTTTGTMSLTVDGVVKATTPGFVARGSWILVKLYTTWSTSGNTNRFIINGDTLTDNTNMGASMPTILFFGWGNAQLNPGKFIYVDDVKLNDASGSYENSAPDDSSGIYYLPVTSDSSIGNWTGGSGGTSNLAQALDNNTPAGLDSSTETNATQIKNSNASGNDSYIGKIKKISDYTDNQARVIPSNKTIRVAQLVVGHGQHRDVVAIDGSAQLLSNPTDPSAKTFIFGDSSSTHGIDVNNGTGDASLEWRRAIGEPIYFPTINRSLNTIIALTKVTGTVHPAEFDQAGLLIEVGAAQGGNPQQKNSYWEW